MSDHDIPPPDDFDELADWLVTANIQFSPAELHGAIVGGLCGTMRLPKAQWAQFGLAVMGVGEAIIASQHENATVTLGGLAQCQLDVLSSEDLLFQPFLPDDDALIEERTAGLSSWCQGFLGGFAEAQAHSQKNADPPTDKALPDNVEEALRDLSAIAQAVVDGDIVRADDDDEFAADPLALGDELFGADDSGLAEDGEDEDIEHDYMEIVEYLRLATLTIFTEFGWIELLHTETREASPDLSSTVSAGSPAGLSSSVADKPGVAKFFKSGNKTLH